MTILNVLFLEEAYCRSQTSTSDIALSVINASRRATILVDLAAVYACVCSAMYSLKIWVHLPLI